MRPNYYLAGPILMVFARASLSVTRARVFLATCFAIHSRLPLLGDIATPQVRLGCDAPTSKKIASPTGNARHVQRCCMSSAEEEKTRMIALCHTHRAETRLRSRIIDPRIGRAAGFTLLELLVVIVIIGLLSGLVVPRYFDTVGKSKAKIAKAQMAALEKALDQYRLDVGAYPTPEQSLNALATQPAGVQKWQGPYLKKAVPQDPWDHPYIYRLSASQQDIELISLGSDGQPGGTGEAKDIALSDKD